MSFALTDEEWALLAGVPREDLIELAAALEVVVPEEGASMRGVVESCVPRLLAQARDQGLPLSKYDEDDVRSLDGEALAALGQLQGVRGRATVSSVLRAGGKVYARRRKDFGEGHDPVAYMVPMLLHPMLRLACSGGAG